MAEPFMQAIDWNNDSMVGNIGKLYQNVDTALDTGPAWANALSYMLPVIGTARTFGDAAENFEQAFNFDGTWEADEVGSFFRGLGDLGLGALSLIPGAGLLGSAVGKGAKLLGKAIPKSAIQGAKTGDKGLKSTMARLAEYGKIGDKEGDAVKTFSSIMRDNNAAKYADRISDATKTDDAAKAAIETARKQRADAEQAMSAATQKLQKGTKAARDAAKNINNYKVGGGPTATSDLIAAEAKARGAVPGLIKKAQKAASDLKSAPSAESIRGLESTQKGTGAALEKLQRAAGSSTSANIIDALTALSEFWKGTEGLGRGARAGAAGTRAILADLLNGGNYDEDYYAAERPATTWLL